MVEIKRVNKFYYCYNDSAKIIHYLFKYKIIGNHVGFPIKSLTKVTDKLSSLHIDYNFDNNTVSFIDNNYDDILAKANVSYSIYLKSNDILKKLKSFDAGKLYLLLLRFNDIVMEVCDGKDY